MGVNRWWWCLVIFLSWVCCCSGQDLDDPTTSSEDPHESEEYDDYMDYAEFVEHDVEDEIYEREFTMLVPKGSIKTEFFVEMEEGMKLDLSSQILSVQESNGRPIPLTMSVKDEEKRVVAMDQTREGKIATVDYKVTKSGVYECVFHVMDYNTDNKNLWVELMIEGKTDVREIDKKFRLKREKKYKAVHDNLITSMKHVQKNQMTAYRHQLTKGHGTRRSQLRVEALSGMIDKWSIIHIVVVLAVMFAQVFVLKGFFTLPTSSSKI